MWALRIPLEHLGARVYPDMYSLAQAHQAPHVGLQVLLLLEEADELARRKTVPGPPAARYHSRTALSGSHMPYAPRSTKG